MAIKHPPGMELIYDIYNLNSRLYPKYSKSDTNSCSAHGGWGEVHIGRCTKDNPKITQTPMYTLTWCYICHMYKHRNVPSTLK